MATLSELRKEIGLAVKRWKAGSDTPGGSGAARYSWRPSDRNMLAEAFATGFDAELFEAPEKINLATVVAHLNRMVNYPIEAADIDAWLIPTEVIELFLDLALAVTCADCGGTGYVCLGGKLTACIACRGARKAAGIPVAD